MTGDELIRHRLHELEEWRVESAATVRSTERDVDLLKLESGTIKGLIVELRTEMRERDSHREKEMADRDERHATSLDRIHKRLDGMATAESYEKGREAGAQATTMRTGKVVAVTLTITIAFGALIVAILTLAGVAPG